MRSFATTSALLFNDTNKHPNFMKFIKILALGAFALGSLGLSSCGCCTGEEPVPPLRPLPVLNEIPVTYEK